MANVIHHPKSLKILSSDRIRWNNATYKQASSPPTNIEEMYKMGLILCHDNRETWLICSRKNKRFELIHHTTTYGCKLKLEKQKPSTSHCTLIPKSSYKDIAFGDGQLEHIVIDFPQSTAQCSYWQDNGTGNRPTITLRAIFFVLECDNTDFWRYGSKQEIFSILTKSDLYLLLEHLGRPVDYSAKKQTLIEQLGKKNRHNLYKALVFCDLMNTIVKKFR